MGDSLRIAAAELNLGILKQRGLMLEQVYDQTEYLNSATDLVQQNIFVGGGLAILVLLLFLRSPRSVLIIGVAIPISVIATFIFIRGFGRSINVISLAGMAFAVGMVVDNAIVVLENIYRHYEAGDSADQAAAKGATEVWGAVLASTLTTLAVFIPVIFMEGQAGQTVSRHRNRHQLCGGRFVNHFYNCHPDSGQTNPPAKSRACRSRQETKAIVLNRWIRAFYRHTTGYAGQCVSARDDRRDVCGRIDSRCLVLVAGKGISAPKGIAIWSSRFCCRRPGITSIR